MKNPTLICISMLALATLTGCATTDFVTGMTPEQIQAYPEVHRQRLTEANNVTYQPLVMPNYGYGTNDAPDPNAHLWGQQHLQLNLLPGREQQPHHLQVDPLTQPSLAQIGGFRERSRGTS